MEILAGTLLTPDTVKATDRILEAADSRVFTWRDGKQGLDAQRPHVTLSQLDLPGDGAHACWLTGAFKSALDTFPLDTPELRTKAVKAWKDGWEFAVKTGLHQAGLGGRMSDGVDVARRFVNAAFPDRQVASYRGDVPRFDADRVTEASFYAAMDFGWMAAFGGFVNADFVGDLLDDGIVQGDAKPIGPNAYGHLSNLFSPSVFRYRVDDNYPKMQGQLVQGLPWRNRYDLDDLELKVQSGQVFPSFYVFLPA